MHIQAGVVIGEGAKIHTGARIGAGAVILSYMVVEENQTIPAGTTLSKSF